ESFVSASSRFYREIDILFISGTDLGQFLFGGWIDGVEIFAGLWGYEPAINEKLIAIAQFNVVARFRRGRVSPAFSEAQLPIFFRNLASVGLAISIDDRELRGAWFPSRHKVRVRKIICALVVGVDHFYQLHQ